MLKPQHLSRLLAVAAIGTLCASYAHAGTTRLHAADCAWMEKAARTGAAEIEAGKLASQKATNPQIRAYAAQMVAAHSQSAANLKALALEKGVPLPDEPDRAHRKALARLEKIGGAQFDQAYLRFAGIKEHADAARLFRQGSSEIHDADVQAFAAGTLPVIEQHLEAAAALERQA